VTSRSFGSFCVAFAAGLLVTVNAFSEESHNLRFGAAMVGLIFIHTLMRWRLWISRELLFYVAFALYNGLSLLWTPNVRDGIPTVQLTANCVFISILFSALIIFHNRRAVIQGILGGFLVGAVYYTRTSGYPFSYPEDFSYNTIAGMYLFGLFMTALYGWHKQSRILPILLGMVLLLLIGATTSIKTNLGVLIGAVAASLLSFKYALRAIARNAILGAAFVGVIAYAVISNQSLMDRVQGGYTRVSMGADVLVAREDKTGGAGLGKRENWAQIGIRGWVSNPVFGEGVEAFRGDFNYTSHSTVVDLLYNTGLIGFMLFYAIFASIAWRLFQARDLVARSPRGLVFGALACYAFISLSGTMYYDVFLSAVMAISAALVTRPESIAPVPSAATAGAHP
jgi:O-antigen ligase